MNLEKSFKFRSGLVLAVLCIGLLASPAGATNEQPRTGTPSYDADGRVDPFEPRHRGPDPEPVCPDRRPKVDELEISGVFILSGNRVAQARAGAHDYLLQEGDRLCDGWLVEILAEKVVVERLLEAPIEVSLRGEGENGGGCAWLPSGARLSCESELVVLAASR